jgi:hypothetical protein
MKAINWNGPMNEAVANLIKVIEVEDYLQFANTISLADAKGIMSDPADQDARNRVYGEPTNTDLTDLAANLEDAADDCDDELLLSELDTVSAYVDQSRLSLLTGQILAKVMFLIKQS